MCARFIIDDLAVEAALALADSANPTLESRPRGDVRPAEPTAALAAWRGGVRAGLMTWGLLRRDGKGLVINTRSETAQTAPMFSRDFAARRCVLPAGGFYEWDPGKTKYTFTDPDAPVLFLAGLFQIVDRQHRFSVLTAPANDSVAPVHHRMPLLLSQEEVIPWLTDPAAADRLLRKELPRLTARH